MSATPIHLFRRSILEFALLVGLLLLTWSVSSPVQAVPTHQASLHVWPSSIHCCKPRCSSCAFPGQLSL
jgi:hypothetical protein